MYQMYTCTLMLFKALQYVVYQIPRKVNLLVGKGFFIISTILFLVLLFIKLNLFLSISYRIKCFFMSIYLVLQWDVLLFLTKSISLLTIIMNTHKAHIRKKFTNKTLYPFCFLNDLTIAINFSLVMYIVVTSYYRSA